MRASQPPDLAPRGQGEDGTIATCARVSKTDGPQSPDLQRDALETTGVDEVDVQDDLASGVRDDRPGLDSCRRALRNGDVLVVRKLDRLGRNLDRLVDAVQNLSARGVGLLAPGGEGAERHHDRGDRLVFGIFAAPAEFEGGRSGPRPPSGPCASRDAPARRDVVPPAHHELLDLAPVRRPGGAVPVAASGPGPGPSAGHYHIPYFRGADKSSLSDPAVLPQE